MPDIKGTGPGIVVAIPVRDEEHRIGRCLAALERQADVPALFSVLLLLNNCTDGSREAARPNLRTMPVTIVERTLPAAEAHVGHARRLAMDAAAALAGPDGLVLTTDADAEAAPDWLAATLAALRTGVSAVAGRVEFDESQAGLPTHALAQCRAERRYADRLAELEALIDPLEHDPWPRHRDWSGANLAVRVAAYRAIGGLPPAAVGEDRALVRALLCHDLRVRHCPSMRVRVSCRLDGRARGGMADTLLRRLDRHHAVSDDRLEPVEHAVRRFARRAEARRGHDVERGPFGARWEAIEQADPLLRAMPLPLSHIEREIRIADRLIAGLRAPALRAGDAPGRPAGIAPFVPECVRA